MSKDLAVNSGSRFVQALKLNLDNPGHLLCKQEIGRLILAQGTLQILRFVVPPLEPTQSAANRPKLPMTDLGMKIIVLHASSLIGIGVKPHLLSRQLPSRYGNH